MLKHLTKKRSSFGSLSPPSRTQFKTYSGEFLPLHKKEVKPLDKPSDGLEEPAHLLCPFEFLPDELIITIFSFLTPEVLASVVLVSKRWRLLSSNDRIWQPFCSAYWEQKVAIPYRLEAEIGSVLSPPEPQKILSWKQVYLTWLRRMATRLREFDAQNEKLLQRYVENKAARPNIPILPNLLPFFWPSYTALRERYTFKILLLGDPDVGKRSMLKRWLENKVKGRVPMNDSVKTRAVEIFGRILELQILDSDSEIFKNSPVSCFLLAHACFVCYDSSITAGLENCRKWFAKIHKFNPHVPFVGLVGMKCDLDGKRCIQTKDGQAFAAVKRIPFMETSAKMNINVEELFTMVTETLFKNFAWPNYIPPEHIFRQQIGLPPTDWCLNDRSSNSDGTKCVIQ